MFGLYDFICKFGDNFPVVIKVCEDGFFVDDAIKGTVDDILYSYNRLFPRRDIAVVDFDVSINNDVYTLNIRIEKENGQYILKGERGH